MALKTYAKGARAERQLIHELAQAGFCVVRAAGSGVSGLSPDLLAFKRGEALALECKSINAETLYIQKQQVEQLRKWQETAGVDVYIAWKQPKEGWLFIRLEELDEAQESYKITGEKARLLNRRLQDLILVR